MTLELEENGSVIKRCPDCGSELVDDEEGGFYCPSSTCPRFMITEEDLAEEYDAAFDDVDDDDEEDED